MFKWLRKRLPLSDVFLNHDNPRDFSTSFWQRDREAISGAYVTYRFMAAGLFLGVLVAAGTTSNYPSFFFIYLTHLGLILQTVYLILSAALPVQKLLHASQGAPDALKMSNTAKVTWFLYNINNVTTLIITSIYWGFVYNPAIHKLGAVNIMIHGLNTVVSIADIFISRRPCRLMHFYQPILCVFIYVLFTFMYWAAGGLNPFGFPYIYAIINWSKPSQTVLLIAIGLMIGLPLIHVFVWTLHQIRDVCLSKLITKTAVSIEPSKASIY